MASIECRVCFHKSDTLDDGAKLGVPVVGERVGDCEIDGLGDGLLDVNLVGSEVGRLNGWRVGCEVGCLLGCEDG